MGMDCYFFKMPRYGDTTPSEVEHIEAYLKYLETPNEKKHETTYHQYFLSKFELPSKDKIEYYSKFFTDKYEDWDVEHEAPTKTIMEEVGYWRRNYMLHDYFTENAKASSYGVYSCREFGPQTLEKFIAFLDEELNKKCLISGKIYPVDENGNKISFHHFAVVYEEEDYCEECNLSTDTMFYWGQDYYDEDEHEDLLRTKRICQEVLQTDFEKYMICYRSSF